MRTGDDELLRTGTLQVGEQVEADPRANLRLVRHGVVSDHRRSLDVIVKSNLINPKFRAIKRVGPNADARWFDPTFREHHFVKEALFPTLAAVAGIACPPAAIRNHEGQQVLVRPWVVGTDLGVLTAGAQERCQLFIDLSTTNQMARIAVLDFLLFNSDRKLENLIVSEAQAIPIDNEFILEPCGLPGYSWQVLAAPWLRYYCANYANEPTLRELVDRAGRDILVGSSELLAAVQRFGDHHDIPVHIEEMTIRVALLQRHAFPVAVSLWFAEAFKRLVACGNKIGRYTCAPDGLA